jgi:hypothetical protein
MNVEIGTAAAQFPEKEYINGSFLAVHKQFVCFTLNKVSKYTMQEKRAEMYD